MDEKIAHLGFIQSIIARMGTNSFMIKGWSITLVAAMFALSAKDANTKLTILAYFPLLMFWILDSFFLKKENEFRELYKMVAAGSIQSNNFTLDPCITKSPGMVRVCFSKTIISFYGFMAALILVAMQILR